MAHDSDDQALELLGEKALAHHRKKVKTFTKGRTKGADHPDTIEATMELVACLSRQGSWAEALPLAKHQLTYYQRMYGGDPDAWGTTAGGEEDMAFKSISGSITNLTTILISMDRMAEAEPLCCKHLDMTQRVKGPEDPETIQRCAVLAGCWLMMNLNEKAEGMQRRVLEFNIRLLGAENEETIDSMQQLGACLGQTGKLREAEQMLRRALELNIRVRGVKHSCTMTNMMNLAYLLKGTGRYAEAEPYAHAAFKGITRDFGPDHHDSRQAASLVRALAQAKGT